jgi:hypothetical protein
LLVTILLKKGVFFVDDVDKKARKNAVPENRKWAVSMVLYTPNANGGKCMNEGGT